jgi:hypothetical protein
MPTLPIRPVDAPLYVVTPIVNPSRYRSRYTLYRNFEKHITDIGAVLYTVEAAYGDRDFAITDATNPRHIRLRTNHELWHKENLISVGVSRLPADWRYVAWIDADVQFARPDIVAETVQQLQHFSVVQMFAHATDLGPRHEPLRSFQGFIAQWMRQIGQAPGTTAQYGAWHPGYAWACRRDAWDHLGGLIDFAIVGSADRYMACGLIGEMARSLSSDLAAAAPPTPNGAANGRPERRPTSSATSASSMACCCTTSTAPRRTAATSTVRHCCGRTTSIRPRTSSATGRASGK